MKVSVVLFGVLLGVILFVSTASARPNLSKSDLSTFDEERDKDSGLFGRDREYENERGRKTRHSRQTITGYDYQSPWYYESYRSRLVLEELLSKIKKLTEDVSDSLRNFRGQAPSNPPQPIYIPYPVYLPIQGIKCSNGVNNNKVNDLHNRFNIPSDIDPNRIWSGQPGDVNTVDNDDGDGSRPISLTPTNINRPQGRPSPPVEHGSSQAGNPTTAAPRLTTEPPVREPGLCEAAILSCCRFSGQQQKQCFTEYGCDKTYATGMACTPKVIQAVIQNFKNAYGPK